MTIPNIGELADVVAVLGEWQVEGMPRQLHPGDVGWFWRFGAPATAAAVRIWRHDGRMAAVGLLDSPMVLRLAVDPEARDDQELARRLIDAIGEPASGCLPPGEADLEVPDQSAMQDLLMANGWVPGDGWTPLRRDLREPVKAPGIRVEVIGRDQVAIRTMVQRQAFVRSTFTNDRWFEMADGPAYDDARCLVAFDGDDEPVAATTVWSAGPGKPGLIEPLGVHQDHRRRGHGTAITLAAAATLRALGASSANVCTPSTNVPAVATYESAGFTRLSDQRDLHRGPQR